MGKRKGKETTGKTKRAESHSWENRKVIHEKMLVFLKNIQIKLFKIHVDSF